MDVWGFKNVELAERLHLQFCKMILHVNKSTPTCMVLGELGRLKIEHIIDIRMLNFWFKNVCNDPSKLSNIFYKLLYNMSERGVYHAEWIKAVKSLLIKYDMYNFWEDQREMRMSNYNMFKTTFKQRIQDYYKNEWQISVNESRKCYIYKGFKSELNLEFL